MFNFFVSKENLAPFLVICLLLQSKFQTGCFVDVGECGTFEPYLPTKAIAFSIRLTRESETFATIYVLIHGLEDIQSAPKRTVPIIAL